MDLYPLRFQPLFKQYIWGGRRLESCLGKAIGPGDDFAESWELVDHEDNQSIVTDGSLKGKTLAELITEFGADLLGTSCVATIQDPARPENLRGRFPLLLKYLDANRVLSVQVHPDDRYGSKMPEPDLGKTESWVVLHAEPESVIYAGLKHGVTVEQLRAAVENGETESCLHTIEPKTGDCVFIPAGTIHAIGAGLVIAEIQQCSNTTFRLFDWNRVDKHGQARPLHLEQSYEVINFESGPVAPQIPVAIDTTRTASVFNLVNCDKFVLNRWRFDQPVELGGDQKFRIATVISGKVKVQGDPSDRPLGLADTILLPAKIPATRFEPNGETEILEISVP